jgi:hypothetical protein
MLWIVKHGNIDSTWPDFAIEPWNLRLAISMDGLNPFLEKLCQWSTSPAYILIKNLPRSLITKRFFMPVALIILGKEKVNMNNIDVFLQPLVGELKTL